MKNGGAGEGIKEFTLWGAKTMDGPWVKLIASEMTKDNGEVKNYYYFLKILLYLLEMFNKNARVWNK